jgi:hypothetical protein
MNMITDAEIREILTAAKAQRATNVARQCDLALSGDRSARKRIYNMALDIRRRVLEGDPTVFRAR